MIKKQQVFESNDQVILDEAETKAKASPNSVTESKSHLMSDEAADTNHSLKPQQAFTGDEFVSEQQLIETLDKHIPPGVVTPVKGVSKLTKLTLLSLLSLVVVQTVLALVTAASQSPWLFGFYAFVLAIVSAWAGRGALIEYRKLKQLRDIDQHQQVAQRLSQSVQTGEADKFINKLLKQYGQSAAVSKYASSISAEHNDAEKLALFESVVVEERDAKASKVVSRFAAEAAVLLAASPLAALDMAIILWRNQKMISQIAQIYGIELGYWSRIKLIRAIVTNIIYAGASEVVTDLGTQMMSMEVTGKLSTRVAQGIGGGLLTARLGYQAMGLCRPVAFSENKRPKLRKVYQQLLSELKAFTKESLSATSSVDNKQPDSDKLAR
ncbi:TIGR01620 family protein [Shewanella maritima]|uniref:TIGR01620 family protein n=1 Tax=Shewanella maritima TaxID=2520507 RepID=A0A411PKZ6_9GAMM|nr:TIGR01620 family protein [Shewanella maritima]QBF84185.1 TIGR01620 family protein [Shewanella maritima]